MREESRRFKEPLPKRIQDKPELYFGLAVYLNAWFDLDVERVRAEGQRIRRSWCFQYAQDYGMDWEQREELWFFIQKMDYAFLEWWQKRHKPPKPATGAVSGKVPKRPR